MLLRLYSVFDVKSGAFGVPFASFNDAVAQRNIAAAMQDGNVLFAKFPEDYQLFRIGSFDDGKGLLSADIPPVCICNVSSLREVVHAS